MSWHFSPTIQNLLHVPAYALLAIFWLQVIRPHLQGCKGIVLVLFLTVGFGIINEFVQLSVPGRYPGIMDIALNTIGSILGIMLSCKLKRDSDTLIKRSVCL